VSEATRPTGKYELNSTTLSHTDIELLAITMIARQTLIERAFLDHMAVQNWPSIKKGLNHRLDWCVHSI